MAAGRFLFGDFALDPAERRLSRGGEPVALNARYLDALALLLRERGRLVTKDRFMDEVWAGVPVTDEALTQCIRTLRRLLGDDAARPRFIETVPKHGYRFVGDAEWTADAAAPPAAPRFDWRRLVLPGGAAAIGGGVAGMVGGLLYGFAAGPQPGMGAASALLVLTALAAVIGLVGGAGVGLGIAAADLARAPRWQWSVGGGAAGGLFVGALVRLLGIDAFQLLLGRAPVDMTGAAEGALLGAAVGAGAWFARGRTPGRAGLYGGGAGAAAGLLVALLGGRLLGGSLELLARQFPDSRFRLEPIAAMFGERGFGPVSQAATSAAEGLIFAGFVVGALALVRRYDRRVAC